MSKLESSGGTGGIAMGLVPPCPTGSRGRWDRAIYIARPVPPTPSGPGDLSHRHFI